VIKLNPNVFFGSA